MAAPCSVWQMLQEFMPRFYHGLQIFLPYGAVGVHSAAEDTRLQETITEWGREFLLRMRAGLDEEKPVDRFEQAAAEMRQAKSALDAIGAEIQQFRARYKLRTDLLDRITACEIPSVRQAQTVYGEWALLQRRKGAALHRFSASLKNWSDAKGAKK
jgi:hypothetical protein